MTDPIALLSAADPAAGLSPTAAQAARIDAAFAPLLDAAHHGSDPALRRRAANRRPRRARGLTPVALVAVAAAVVAVAPWRGTAPASAATVLTQLGRKVADAPAQAGRYAYVRRLNYVSQTRAKPGGGEFVMVVPMESRMWVAGDGTIISEGVSHEDQATFPTPADRAAYEASTKWATLDGLPHAEKGLPVAGMTAEQVAALPSDPEQLRQAIAKDPTGDAAQLLGWPLTPRPVKAALYEVLKTLPGARLAGTQEDPSGRSGVGIEFDDAAWTTLFIFDPATGELIATREHGKQEAHGRGTTDWSLTLEEGRSDDAPTPVGRTQDWTGR